MKSAPAQAIVTFLSFPNQWSEATAAIERFSPREWSRVIQWMDDGGLAFFFLKKLLDTGATPIVPASVLSRLQRNSALNRTRMDDMLRRFQLMNKQFEGARVRYAVVKGFSLVPEFCPDASLRHQADLDYLIDRPSLPVARRVLADAGYKPRHSVSAEESIFVSVGARPARGDAQYSPAAGHAVELHTNIWDNDMHGLQEVPHFFQLSQARSRHSSGPAFFALPDQDAFVLQVLHACRHLFTQWIRMSCLFEIAYFLNRRALDEKLWCAVEQRTKDYPVLREFVVIVSEMVAQLFAPSVPALIKDWAVRIRPATRVWIDHYARNWAFCELPVHQLSLCPGSKLVLFLQQQYKRETRSEGAADKPLSNEAPSPGRKTSLLLSSDWRKRKHLLRRSIYYTLAQARYLYEIPRWRWLNRGTASASPGRYLPGRRKADEATKRC